MTNDAHDLTDDEIEQYAAEFEDLPEKVLLVEILAELKAIRQALTQADADSDDSPTEYVCRRCEGDRTVPADDRVRHARSEHTAPPGEEESLFRPVE